jgi:hypothetical protein
MHKNNEKSKTNIEKSVNEILGELSYLLPFYPKYSRKNFGLSENILKNYDKETIKKLLEVIPEKLYYENKESGLILGLAMSLNTPDETIDFFKRIYDSCNKNINEAKKEIKNLAENYAENRLEIIVKETVIAITEEFKEYYKRIISNYDFYRILDEKKQNTEDNRNKDKLVKALYSRINKLYNAYTELRKNEKENYFNLLKITRKNIISKTDDFDKFVNYLKNKSEEGYKFLLEELSKVLGASYKITEEPVSGEGRATIHLECPSDEPGIKIVFEQGITFEKENELKDDLEYYKNSIFYELGLVKEKPELPKNDKILCDLLLKNKK